MERRAFIRKTLAGAAGLAAFQRAGRRGFASSEAPSTRADAAGALPQLPPNSGSPTYGRLKEYLDSIPSIDSHEHLYGFDALPGFVETERGRGMNLYGVWQTSYIVRYVKIEPWQPKEPFQSWWERAKSDFDNVRATGFYRYMWLAFRDLYGVDFDRITDAQAADLDRRIFDNYRSPEWLYHVLHDKANIKLIVCDRFWERFNFRADYPFEFLTFNVSTLGWGFHPSEYDGHLHRGKRSLGPFDNPYHFAAEHGLPMNFLDDYLALLDVMFSTAKQGDCICLKTTAAYNRTLQFDNVPKEEAARIFGRPRSELGADDVKAFEDFIMWRLAELSAKHEMPFQIHTGDARIQGSNPLLLVNLIDANPQTKFELFHGGYPWVGETAAIGMKYPANVWINSVWLPTISYSMAKRAWHEWLDVVPANHLTWGGDDYTAESIYGEAELTRRSLAEALAERVERGDLLEADARQIAHKILRDNALESSIRA